VNQSGGSPKEEDRHFTRIESYRLPSETFRRAGISTLMLKQDARHFKGPDPSVSSGYKIMQILSQSKLKSKLKSNFLNHLIRI